jgi:hypothetical protein
MVNRFYEAKMMKKKRQLKLVQAGEYVAEVEVELIYTDEGWSPYLSLNDALKLDEVRELLWQGEIEVAASLARIFKLTPVVV